MYELRIDASQAVSLVTRLDRPHPASRAGRRFGRLVNDVAVAVQTQAIHNVSGYPVFFNGRAFIVRPRTGALKGSISTEWPYQNLYRARVFVNGTHTAATQYPGIRTRPTPVSRYAAAVEYGHREIDLKKTMRGKIVPFFAARSQSATGPYAAVGLTPLSEGPGSQSPGSKWTSKGLNNRLQAKGKKPMIFTQKGKATSRGGSGTYYIAFRRVGKKGWIIPEKIGRPFMGATMTQVEPVVRRKIREAVRDVVRDR